MDSSDVPRNASLVYANITARTQPLPLVSVSHLLCWHCRLSRRSDVDDGTTTTMTLRRWFTIRFLFILQIFAQLGSKVSTANCTSNCLNTRREWPKLDFEFYYEHSGDGPPLESSGVSYSLHDSSSMSFLSTQLTPSLMSTSIITSFASATNNITISPVFVSPSSGHHVSGEWEITPTNAPLPGTTIIPSKTVLDCFGENRSIEAAISSLSKSNMSQNMLQKYLLRTVFRNMNNFSDVADTLSKDLQHQLTLVFQHALNEQRKQLHQRQLQKRQVTVDSQNLNITIWDLQVDNSMKTIDVVYYIQRDGVLIPFEDAAKMASFVSNEYIRNQTGYEVIHKLRRYDENDRIEEIVKFGWLNWLILLALIFLLIVCFIVIGLLYRKRRNDQRRWLETVNKELNRANPSELRTDEEDENQETHWNYGQQFEEEEEDDDHDGDGAAPARPRPTDSSRAADRQDKSSQCDYEAGQHSQESLQRNNDSSNSGQYRERLIPIGSGSSASEPEYDRISYMRTHEILQETKKHPNILEIHLSKETQSIVQEIRKELNRYNFKKIIVDSQNTSSEA